MLPEYIISADLGQRQDYTALAVLECRQGVAAGAWDGSDIVRLYDAVHLERLPLNTPYTALPGVLERIEQAVRRRWLECVWAAETELARQGRRLAWHPTAADAPVALVVDATGVGVAVVDYLRAAGLEPTAITITGGDVVIRVADDQYRVPKRDLAAIVQVLLQTRRLRIAAALPEAETLRRELENFRAKITLSGHDRYGAGADWREGNHDDLVLAVAMACWLGEERERDVMRPARPEVLATFRR